MRKKEEKMLRHVASASFLVSLAEKGFPFFSPIALTRSGGLTTKTKALVLQRAESSPNPSQCPRGNLGSRRWTACACRWAA